MSVYGRLIVFEGPDGVGKTTLANALVTYLNETGENSEYVSFPGRDEGTLGRLVYQLHHEPTRHDVQMIDPVSMQILHVAAHVDTIKRRIFPAMEAGRSVVLDRFWWSTWVYGLADGVGRRSLRLMLDLEAHEWGKVAPDMLFLLTRDQPLGNKVSLERFQKLSGLYAKLAKRRRSHHAVEVINNDGRLERALMDIAGALAVEKRGFDQADGSDPEPLSPSIQEVKKKQESPTFFLRAAPPKATKVYDAYWRFAAERQRIFF